jgi:outer membrane protein assembly factor BamE (lipoprotein component of BamABCDE complex)
MMRHVESKDCVQLATTGIVHHRTMKRTFIVSLFVSAGLLGLVGCASDNQGQKAEQPKKEEAAKDDRPMDQRLVVGMTKDDVRKTFGDPGSTAVSSDGLETWTYSDHAKAFIPFYSISGGKFHHTVISFDKDGKVKSWSTNESSAY